MALLLSAGELLQLRALAATAMPDTASLVRSTKGRSAAGGITNSWTTIGSYACNVAPITSGQAAELVVQGQFFDAQPWLVLLPTGTPVLLRDRLLIGGRTFEVRGVGQGVSSWEVLVETFCVEVT